MVEPEAGQEHGGVFRQIKTPIPFVGATQGMQLEVWIVVGQSLDKVRERAQGRRRARVPATGLFVIAKLLCLAPTPLRRLRASRLPLRMVLASVGDYAVQPGA